MVFYLSLDESFLFKILVFTLENLKEFLFYCRFNDLFGINSLTSIEGSHKNLNKAKSTWGYLKEAHWLIGFDFFIYLTLSLLLICYAFRKFRIFYTT